MIIKEQSLMFCPTNAGGKEYLAQLIDNCDGTYTAQSSFGPKGNLRSTAIQAQSVSLEVAFMAYTKVIKSKLNGSSVYSIVSQSTPTEAVMALPVKAVASPYQGDVAIVYITKSTILRGQGPAHIAAIPPTKEETLVGRVFEKMFAGRVANLDNKLPTCEYNSELAAAVQTAYETQSGMRNTNCDGLSKEQLMSIDFNAIVFPANYLQNLRDRAESALKTTSGDQPEPNEAITEALDFAYTYAVSNKKASHGEALGASFYKAVEEIVSADTLNKKE